MKKKFVWLMVSGWMVAALLLAACAPAVVEEEKVVLREEVVPKEEVVPREVVVPKGETNLVKWTGKKLDGTVVEKMLEKPRYGGIHVTVGKVQPTAFDDIFLFSFVFGKSTKTCSQFHYVKNGGFFVISEDFKLGYYFILYVFNAVHLFLILAILATLSANFSISDLVL